MARNPAEKFLQKKEAKTPTSFSLSTEVIGLIDTLAKAHGISRSDVVTGAIKLMHEISSKGK